MDCVPFMCDMSMFSVKCSEEYWYPSPCSCSPLSEDLSILASSSTIPDTQSWHMRWHPPANFAIRDSLLSEQKMPLANVHVESVDMVPGPSASFIVTTRSRNGCCYQVHCSRQMCLHPLEACEVTAHGRAVESPVGNPRGGWGETWRSQLPMGLVVSLELYLQCELPVKWSRERKYARVLPSVHPVLN